MSMLCQISETENNLASNMQSANDASDSTPIDAVDVEMPEVISLISPSVSPVAEDVSSQPLTNSSQK